MIFRILRTPMARNKSSRFFAPTTLLERILRNKLQHYVRTSLKSLDQYIRNLFSHRRNANKFRESYEDSISVELYN